MAFQALRKFASTGTRTAPSCVQILPEVADALSSGRPVVALESTIVAHGMPYPQNLELAKDVSSILRNKGVIPATIAIKNGVFRAGLHPDELENLSLAGEEGRAIKCSTRDLPLVASKHRNMNLSEENVQWGATTVAATMRLAHAAGISTFVTGGTGGVHRGGELSLDISTDLIELSRTPVVVISAGVKSILDIKRTMEVLETFAVPAGSWKSDEFPAFFSPKSGVKSPAMFENGMDVASAYLIGRELGMTSGMLVAVPNHDPAGEAVEIAIQEALREAKEAGIEGRDVTPFILQTVAKKTGGDSLRSNMSLVKRNAEVGADIANSIMELSLRGSTVPLSQPQIVSTQLKSRVVCVGGAVIDTIAKSISECEMIVGTSNPGIIHRSDGGVGRNVAEVIGRLGSKPLFYTAIGNDDGGQGLVMRLEKECGVVTTEKSVHVVETSNTAQYLALLDHNSDLVGGVADMEALTEIPIPSVDELCGVDFLVIDANAPTETVMEAAKNGVKAECKVCFEPTSVPKAKLLSSIEFIECLSYVFPNEDELFAMAEALDDGIESEGGKEGTGECTNKIRAAASKLLSIMKSEKAHIVVTRGSSGVLLASRANADLSFMEFPVADSIPEIKSSNGAGDTLCGAFIGALLQGANEEAATTFGMKAALLSLDCAEHAISPDVSSMAVPENKTR
ncbi:hypothetical protein ACHAXR_008542 [Thalassiosira sp. AJA248-18]